MMPSGGQWSDGMMGWNLRTRIRSVEGWHDRATAFIIVPLSPSFCLLHLPQR